MKKSREIHILILFFCKFLYLCSSIQTSNDFLRDSITISLTKFIAGIRPFPLSQKPSCLYAFTLYLFSKMQCYFFNYAPNFILNNDNIMTLHYVNITRMDGHNSSEIYFINAFWYESLLRYIVYIKIRSVETDYGYQGERIFF